MTTTAKILREARALIEDPDHWTTGVLAVDEQGQSVSQAEPSACRFCMVGAVLRVTEATFINWDSPVHEALSEATGSEAFGDWNDSHDHAEVLAAFDRAIEAAS